MADEAQTEDEASRLEERARRIWGENPFSAENMARDAHHQDIATRTGRIQHRLAEMERLDEEEKDRDH